MSFLREFANSSTLTKIPDVPMEGISLIKIGNAQFQNSVATLVGVDDNIGDGCTEDNVKSLLAQIGIPYKFIHRAKGWLLQFFLYFLLFSMFYS